jgi:hypothetical protein
MSPNVHWNLQVISQDELHSVAWLVTSYDAHVSKGDMNKQVVLKIIKGVNPNGHVVLVEPWVIYKVILNMGNVCLQSKSKLW